LEEKRADGKKDRNRALNTLSAFVRHQMNGHAMPKLSWKHDDADGKLRLSATAEPAPLAARLWICDAPTRDFRKAAWKEQEATCAKGKVMGLVAPPEQGFRAFFAELDFEIGDLRYTLSTQMRVAGKEK
jgi:PhoPQ-activated pathogenicity-related protein